MFEVDEAAKIITESVDPDANIIFGTSIVPDYDGQTGFWQLLERICPGSKTLDRELRKYHVDIF